jgi:uncharacterized protein with von Willebrand factor type A (vWA) domain
VTAGTDAIELVTDLSRRLRERGIATTTESTIDGVRTLAAVDVADRATSGSRFSLVRPAPKRSRDLRRAVRGVVDDDSLGGRGICAAPGGTAPEPGCHRPGDEPERAGASTALTKWAESLTEADDEEPVPLAAPSVRDTTGTRDFRRYTSDDLAALEQVASEIVRRLRSRRSRRWRHARRGGRLDPRRIVRLALATGGDPIRLARRERTLRRTKLVVLCDVSGSMDLYSRFLLQVIYALQHAFARVGHSRSAHAWSVSPIRSRRSYREALDAPPRSHGGWSGGTKIGESVEAVRVGWPRLFDRRTAVVILSDGWDTGDPEILAQRSAICVAESAASFG